MGKTLIKMQNGQLFNMSKNDLCSSSKTSRVIEIILTLFRNEPAPDDNIVDLKNYIDKDKDFDKKDCEQAMFEFLKNDNKLVPLGIGFTIYKDFENYLSWVIVIPS